MNMRFWMPMMALGLMASPAIAYTAQDSAISEGGRPVVSNFGECVRTKWQAPSDPCAPEPPPAPAAPAYTPPPPPPAPPVPQVSLEQRTVYFDFNKSELHAEGKAKLDSLIDIIIKSKGIRSATVLGYADEIGKPDKNLALSQQRANAVNDYMARRVTIPTSVLMISGKGEEGSVTDCPKNMKRKERIACLAKDRRVEIEFNYVH